MNSTITYPFIQTELDYRREQLQPGAAARRRGTRTWSRRRLARSGGNR